MRAATGAAAAEAEVLERLLDSRFLPLRWAWNTTTGAFDVPMLAARCLARRALASARTTSAAARAAPHAPRRLSTVNLTFVDFEGESFAVTGTEGETVLEAALAADIEIEAARVLPRPSARARAARRTRRAGRRGDPRPAGAAASSRARRATSFWSRASSTPSTSPTRRRSTCWTSRGASRTRAASAASSRSAPTSRARSSRSQRTRIRRAPFNTDILTLRLTHRHFNRRTRRGTR